MVPRVLVIDPRDNVGVALVDISSGTQVEVKFKNRTANLLFNQNVPRGHKVALVRVPKSKAIIKFGEMIGYARIDIERGDHVHAHNVVGRDELR
jgi:altronate dehydratase small subunit